MKPVGASVVIGVILSLVVIYIFQPLNSGAVALVVVLCVGVAAILIAMGRRFFGEERWSRMRFGCLAAIAVIVGILSMIIFWEFLSVPRSPPKVTRPSPVVAVRAFLFTGEPTPQGYGAYGYLLFNTRPSQADLVRYMLVCDSFRRDLVETWGKSPEERRKQMATFWPLETRAIAVDYSCQTLIEKYDYRRAVQIATAVGKQGSRGPVLTAWTRPFEENDSEALVLDLSDFSNEDLDRAFAIWRERITTNPEAWQDGLNLVVFREAFRNLLQTYGEQILGIIRPSKGG
jgi:hypothetical protein